MNPLKIEKHLVRRKRQSEYSIGIEVFDFHDRGRVPRYICSSGLEAIIPVDDKFIMLSCDDCYFSEYAVVDRNVIEELCEIYKGISDDFSQHCEGIGVCTRSVIDYPNGRELFFSRNRDTKNTVVRVDGRDNNSQLLHFSYKDGDTKINKRFDVLYCKGIYKLYTKILSKF